MHNRIVTLFDLDELLGAGTVRPGVAPRKPGVKPASSAGAKTGSKQVKAQAFDYGGPIRLQYGDAQARSVSRPIPPAPGKARSRGQSQFVGAFEDENADSAQVAEPEEAEEDELAGLEIREEDAALLADEQEEEPETEDSSAQSHRAPPPPRRPLPSSPSHAQQVAAFEREIQDLAAKRPPQSAPSGVPVEDTSSPDDAGQARPPQAGGHYVFDQMAKGMEYVNQFRLPPVEVKRLFRELDQQMDRQAERERSRAAAAEPVIVPTVVAPALALPDDAVLAGDLAHLSPPVDPAQAAEVLAEQLGTGKLLHFAPEELELDDEETLAVFAFFWPDMNLEQLGQITDQDRSFAQALLIEAADASHAMSIVDAFYKNFFMKVPTGFKSIRNALLKVAKRAVEDQWFKKVKTVAEAEKVQIYDSVRTTVARNFRTVLSVRRATGELTGY